MHFMFPSIKKGSSDAPQLSSNWLSEWRHIIPSHPYITYFDWIQNIASGENKQGLITKSDCHELIRVLSLKSYEDNVKIQLIWLPEIMGQTANALLKIIEEPPLDTHFILVSENLDAVLGTILSRTQIYKLPPIDDVSIAENIQSKFGKSSEEAARIAGMSLGSWNQACRLAEGIEEVSNVLTVKEMLRYPMRKSLKNTRDAVEGMTKFAGVFHSAGREVQKNFLGYVSFFCREAIQLKLIGSCTLKGEELEFAQAWIKVVDADQIHQTASVLDQTAYHIERYGYAKSVIMGALIKLSRIFAGEKFGNSILV